MDILVTIHSVLRWAVLAVLVGGGTYALLRAPEDPGYDPRPVAVAIGIVDLQVVLGIAVYLLGSAWEDNAFIAYVHPAVMVAAAALLHVAAAGARRQPSGRSAYRRVGSAFLFALVLMALGIPWNR